MNADDLRDLWKQPMRFVRIFWPDVILYNKQKEILQSVVDNDETIVRAGNMLGVQGRSG